MFGGDRAGGLGRPIASEAQGEAGEEAVTKFMERLACSRSREGGCGLDLTPRPQKL